MTSIDVRLRVNGKDRHVKNLDPRNLLVDVLRDHLGLTGTHIGCLTGNCGACTVMMNGHSVKSCTVVAAEAEGVDVVTVEGLLSDDTTKPLRERLNAIQTAFIENHGLQCGYCTPGMIISAYQLLMRNPNPTTEEIKAGISGNLCRCTGYTNIVKAVRQASKTFHPDR